eukprot:354817-Chlamydomonas_euryale.AAC.3
MLGHGGVLEKNALLGCPNLLIYVDIPRSGTRTWGRVLRSNKQGFQESCPGGSSLGCAGCMRPPSMEILITTTAIDEILVPHL